MRRLGGQKMIYVFQFIFEYDFWKILNFYPTPDSTSYVVRLSFVKFSGVCDYTYTDIKTKIRGHVSFVPSPRSKTKRLVERDIKKLSSLHRGDDVLHHGMVRYQVATNDPMQRVITVGEGEPIRYEDLECPPEDEDLENEKKKVKPAYQSFI